MNETAINWTFTIAIVLATSLVISFMEIKYLKEDMRRLEKDILNLKYRK